MDPPKISTTDVRDWEENPPWPLPHDLAIEEIVWQRAHFILQGTRLSDGLSVSQIVDIGRWWNDVVYRTAIEWSISRSGFPFSGGGVEWIGVPMRTGDVFTA